MLDWKGFESQLRLFQRRRPIYELAGAHLRQLLAEVCRRQGLHPILSSRAKAVASFAEKIRRPGKSYTDPVNQLTDLCGVRAVVHTSSDVERLRAAFQRALPEHGLMLDEDQSLDAAERLEVDEFGYLSKHLIVVVEERPFVPEPLREIDAEIGRLSVEVQLRTLAQHAWADVFHDTGYKNEFELPRRLKRQFARAAALLEQTDEVFRQIGERVADLSLPGYQAYLTEAECRSLAERLEQYDKVFPGDLEALTDLLRAYKSLQRWQDMIDLLARAPKLAERNEVLREVGVAHHQLVKNEADAERRRAGLDTASAYLRQALDLDPGDTDAHCSLGGVLRSYEEHAKARDAYGEALRVDPSNPYALGNYIGLEARLRENLDHLEPLRAARLAAQERCVRQIEVRVNLPWAWFDKALFHLCAGEIRQAQATYGKALRGEPPEHQPPAPWAIDTHLRSLSDLCKTKPPGFDGVIEQLRPYASPGKVEELGLV